MQFVIIHFLNVYSLAVINLHCANGLSTNHCR